MVKHGMEAKEETFRAGIFDCAADGSIHLFALMKYLQEIAADHAEELGFGFARMREMNAYWVLSNIRIEISRLPLRDELFIVKTWPSGCSRTVATREFLGKDQQSWFMTNAKMTPVSM